MYISAFNEVGQLLLGMSANDLQNLKDNDEPAFEKVFEKTMGFTWCVSIKARTEQYNDTSKIRYQVNKAVP